MLFGLYTTDFHPDFIKITIYLPWGLTTFIVLLLIFIAGFKEEK